MATMLIRSAAITGAAAVVLAMSPVMPEAMGASGAPPASCDGRPATILGTDGSDNLSGTSGDDVVSLGAGRDTFETVGGHDIVCGGDDRDILIGGEGNDRLFGEGGDDMVIGGRGDDLVDGGDGDDVLYGDQLGGHQLPGLDGADQVLGGPGNDSVELVAGDGSGSGGADAADGGEGTDRVSYASSLVGVTIDVPAGIAHGDVDDTLTGFEAYRGSYHGDTMLGSDGPDVFDALEAWGDDVDQLDGRGGDDTLTADEGTILGGAGDDTYRASARPTRDLGIWLGAGDDRAEIQQGRTTVVRGGAGDDVFAVIQPDYGKVQPRLHGGPGTDLLSFARFDHPVSVDLAARTASAKKLRAGVYGVEQVDGTFGADRLWGRAGPDVLRGLAGADTLSGRRGPDTLLGGKAHDRANGGPGRDTCAAESQTACEKPA